MNHFTAEYKKAKEIYDNSVVDYEKIKIECVEDNTLLFDIAALRFLQSIKSDIVIFTNKFTMTGLFSSLEDIPNTRVKNLSNAALLYEKNKKRMEINTYVKENPFLPDTLLLPEDFLEMNMAKEYLEIMPLYSKLYTNEMKQKLAVSALSSFPFEQLKDIPNSFCEYIYASCEDFPVNGNETYEQNMNKLRRFLKDQRTASLQQETEEVIVCKLKGVTFDNEDGTKKQNILKEMQEEYPKEIPPITLEKWSYHYEPAVRVLWNGKCIGNLPADVAKDIHDRYREYILQGKVLEVTGGGDIYYGAKIEVHVKGYLKEAGLSKEILQKDSVENTIKIKDILKKEEELER